MATYMGINSIIHNYAHLPMEIILKIFRNLQHADRLSAGSTCLRWRTALLDPEFNENVVVRFSKVCLSDALPPAQNFLRCERNFRHFQFEDVIIGNVTALMQRIGQTVETLVFDNSDMSDKQFYFMIREMPRLRKLTITHCSQMFMSGSFLDNADDRNIVENTLSNVRHLSLSRNQYLTDAILLRITSFMQNLESLDLSGCQIAYHGALQRRFYPIESGDNASESILTFKFLLRILSSHRTHLQELNLSDTLISSSALESLVEMGQDGLNLRSLQLARCRQLYSICLINFLPTQYQLTKLDLSESPGVTDIVMDVIVTGLPQLVEANFRGCASITKVGAIMLANLKMLQSLNISHCDGIDSDGITQGIASAHNYVLRELHMSHLKVDEDCIKHLAQQLPRLCVLNVAYCVNAVTDDAMQSILQHLQQLRELSVEHCFKLTDSALTGISMTQLNSSRAAANQMLQNFNPPTAATLAELESWQNSMQPVKISLRSKAEAEIVADAKRKQAMLDAYELNMLDEVEVSGYSIKELKKLQVLNLTGCNKITDVSLKYGLKFPHLRNLSLAHCQQITFVGMETLVRDCCSIEVLNLSDCYNITDKCIQQLTEHLKRLRILHLSGCTQLTDHSLDAILIHCKRLQTLSVHRCRHMTYVEDRLAELSTLRTLNVDNANSMDSFDVYARQSTVNY